MEILGSLHHFVAYETDAIATATYKAINTPINTSNTPIKTPISPPSHSVSHRANQPIDHPAKHQTLTATTATSTTTGVLALALASTVPQVTLPQPAMAQAPVPQYVVVNGTNTIPVATVTSRSLRQGMSGEQVLLLQNQLRALGYFSVNPTGYFGSITEAAVTRFQSDNALVVDGIAGVQTVGLLAQVVNASLPSNQVVLTTQATTPPPVSRTVRTVAPPVTSVPITSVPASTSRTTVTPTLAYNPSNSIDGAKVGTELYVGSLGDVVLDLQRSLQQLGQYTGPITGYFGPLTLDAVENFQQENKLPPTGIVGVKTWNLINQKLNR